MRRTLLSAAAALAVAGTGLGSGSARAQDPAQAWVPAPAQAPVQGRQGMGRIDLAIGPRLIPNQSFVNAQQISGNLFSTWSAGPIALATFGYWLDDHFELSLEGTYGYDTYSVPGKAAWRIQTMTLGGTTRFAPFAPFATAWPYFGLNFGFSLNHVVGYLNPPEEADGYGSALMIGSGFDFSSSLGASVELRYAFSNVRVPGLAPTLNTGGLSILFGIYLRLQKPPDEFGHQE